MTKIKFLKPEYETKHREILQDRLTIGILLGKITLTEEEIEHGYSVERKLASAELTKDAQPLSLPSPDYSPAPALMHKTSDDRGSAESGQSRPVLRLVPKRESQER